MGALRLMGTVGRCTVDRDCDDDVGVQSGQEDKDGAVNGGREWAAQHVSCSSAVGW